MTTIRACTLDDVAALAALGAETHALHVDAEPDVHQITYVDQLGVTEARAGAG